jgi:hypothetical protein
MSNTILDNIVGGAKLPHVYCKKIKVENNPAGNSEGWGQNPTATAWLEENGYPAVKITLNLVLYEKAVNDSLSATWFKSFSDPNKPNSMLDYLFLHVQPILDVNFLKPSNVGTMGGGPGAHANWSATEAGAAYGSVYMIDHHTHASIKAAAPKNWWPYNAQTDTAPTSWSTGAGTYIRDHVINAKKHAHPHLFTTDATTAQWFEVPPYSLRLIDYIDAVPGASTYGADTLATEIINGIPYHAVPFQRKYTFPLVSPFTGLSNLSLGFMFYTFLNVEAFFNDKFGDVLGTDSAFQEYLNEFMLRGPINTEIVYDQGQIAQEREEFFLPGGEIWEGSVHYHGASAGLQGEYVGWMTGDKHAAAKTQPKLTVEKYPNYKIDDFTNKNFQAPQETIY